MNKIFSQSDAIQYLLMVRYVIIDLQNVIKTVLSKTESMLKKNPPTFIAHDRNSPNFFLIFGIFVKFTDSSWDFFQSASKFPHNSRQGWQKPGFFSN